MKRFLHDSTDTGGVPPLDPVAQDVSRDDTSGDLFAAGGQLLVLGRVQGCATRGGALPGDGQVFAHFWP